MTRPEPITRPNGKLYRPRKLIAAAVDDGDGGVGGVMILGTHDTGRAQAFANEYAMWVTDEKVTAIKPLPGWYREGFSGGELRWISDEEHGRAGVWFQELAG